MNRNKFITNIPLILKWRNVEEGCPISFEITRKAVTNGGEEIVATKTISGMLRLRDEGWGIESKDGEFHNIEQIEKKHKRSENELHGLNAGNLPPL